MIAIYVLRDLTIIAHGLVHVLEKEIINTSLVLFRVFFFSAY
jgi:hypothetical protein